MNMTAIQIQKKLKMQNKIVGACKKKGEDFGNLIAQQND